MSDTSVTAIKDTTANPAPLGLLAFGTTTVLLNLHNAGFFALNSMILAMGIFYGGLAQVVAGILEWKKGNTFGTTAFTSYGFFWLTLVALVLLPKSHYAATAADGTAMAAYLAVWGIFTLGLFIGTLRLSRALQVVFFTLVVLFFLLAYAEAGGGAGVAKFAGYEGIFCGLSAMYAGFASVLNEVYGRVVLPVGPVVK
ncbi:MAG TPA: acetate uptake transporter [Opitutus sp.]|nr:acetate uptake transporter [Opitutus sp.]